MYTTPRVAENSNTTIKSLPTEIMRVIGEEVMRADNSLAFLRVCKDWRNLFNAEERLNIHVEKQLIPLLATKIEPVNVPQMDDSKLVEWILDNRRLSPPFLTAKAAREKNAQIHYLRLIEHILDRNQPITLRKKSAHIIKQFFALLDIKSLIDKVSACSYDNLKELAKWNFPLFSYFLCVHYQAATVEGKFTFFQEMVKTRANLAQEEIERVFTFIKHRCKNTPYFHSSLESLLWGLINNNFSNPTIFLFLNDNAIDLNTRINKETLLILACQQHNSDLLLALLDHGADINGPNFMGATLLHRLLSQDKVNSELIRTLLEKGANPNAPAHNGTTPLHVACRNKNLEISIIQILLENGANFNLINKVGDTPWALLQRNHSNIVKLLQKKIN